MTWALLWSQRRNSVRAETLENHLSDNRLSYRDNMDHGWIILFTGAEREMKDAATSVDATLKQRAAG